MQAGSAYLHGYYGMKNSGDDALLLAAAMGAKSHLGVNRLMLNSPIALILPLLGAFKANLVTKQNFPGHNRLLQYATAVQSQQLIFGGGSVIHNKRDINIMRHLMKLAGQGPHRAIGVGLGPFKNTKAERACQAFLHECDFVGVRDAESFQIAQSLAPQAAVSLTFDLAPLLLDIPGLIISTRHIQRRGIAVALCPKERLVGDDAAELKRIKSLAKALTDSYRLTGEPLYLVDLNGHATLGDRQVHDQLRQYISSDIPVFRIEYDANPLRLITRLSCMKVVVAMRLHASILSYMVDTPVVSINYHRKCFAWCEQAGIDDSYCIDASDISVEQLLTALETGLSDGFIAPKLPIMRARICARNNFLPLEELSGVSLC